MIRRHGPCKAPESLRTFTGYLTLAWEAFGLLALTWAVLGGLLLL